MNDGLRLGMFLAGALVAAVPMSLALGVGIYVLRRYLRERATETSEEPPET